MIRWISETAHQCTGENGLVEQNCTIFWRNFWRNFLTKIWRTARAPRFDIVRFVKKKLTTFLTKFVDISLRICEKLLLSTFEFDLRTDSLIEALEVDMNKTSWVTPHCWLIPASRQVLPHSDGLMNQSRIVNFSPFKCLSKNHMHLSYYYYPTSKMIRQATMIVRHPVLNSN